MYILLGIGVVLLVVLVVKAAMGSRTSGNLPPGPPPKPLLGNLLDVDTDKLHVSFTDISRQFGDVFTLHISGKTIVVINTIEAFRELFEEGKYGDNLCGRERNFVTRYVYGEKDLPQCSNTPGYRKRRATLYSSTNSFSCLHERKLYEELGHVVNFVESKSAAPQDLAEPVKLYLTSIYLTALSGERYEYDDPRLRTLIERVDVVQNLILPRVNGLMSKLPWMRHLPFGNGATYDKSQSLKEKLWDMIFDPIKVSYNLNVTRGGIDCLIRAQKEADEAEAGEMTDEYLWESAFSTIGAGTGVGIGYIVYFFVVILHQPEIAEKIRSEIDIVIGRDRLPTLADRAAMLYTQATLVELLRWVSPAPLLLPRRLENDIKFRNYTLPKDATLITNAWKIHHDETTWEDPWQLKPERFLGPKGEIREDLKKNVIAFGGGKRQCIGQSLASDTAFLFLTAMLQRFTFSAPAGSDLPHLDPHFHTKTCAGIKPEPFKVTIKSRNGGQK